MKGSDDFAYILTTLADLFNLFELIINVLNSFFDLFGRNEATE